MLQECSILTWTLICSYQRRKKYLRTYAKWRASTTLQQSKRAPARFSIRQFSLKAIFKLLGSQLVKKYVKSRSGRNIVLALLNFKITMVHLCKSTTKGTRWHSCHINTIFKKNWLTFVINVQLQLDSFRHLVTIQKRLWSMYKWPRSTGTYYLP